MTQKKVEFPPRGHITEASLRWLAEGDEASIFSTPFPQAPFKTKEYLSLDEHEYLLQKERERAEKLVEAAKDCVRYIEHASKKHVLPEGAVRAQTLCLEALAAYRESTPAQGKGGERE